MIVLSVTSAATLVLVAPVTASATPGDADGLNEPIVLSIAISDITKGQHLLDFAGNRLREKPTG